MKSNNRKGNVSVLTVVLIAIIVAILTAGVVYFIMSYTIKNDKTLEDEITNDDTTDKKEEIEESVKENKIFNSGDYGVEYISSHEGVNKAFSNDVKKLVEEKTSKEGIYCSSVFNFEKNNKISSVYYILKDTNVSYDDVYYPEHKSISYNVDLKTQKELTNEEMIKLYNKTNYEVAKEILNDLVSNVTREQLLKSTEGDIMAPKINTTDLIDENQNYILELSNKLNESITTYVKNDSLYVDYYHREVLEVLGLGSHMNIGLKFETQTIKL